MYNNKKDTTLIFSNKDDVQQYKDTTLILK